MTLNNLFNLCFFFFFFQSLLQVDTPNESEADVESDATSLDAAPSPEKGFKGEFVAMYPLARTVGQRHLITGVSGSGEQQARVKCKLFQSHCQNFDAPFFFYIYFSSFPIIIIIITVRI